MKCWTLLGIVIAFLVASLAFAKDKGGDPGLNLKARGHELTEESLGKILQDKTNPDDLSDCLAYIEEHKIVGLLPDLKKCLEDLDRPNSGEKWSEGYKLMYVQCIFALDKDMNKKTLDAYLARIRRLLFEVSEGRPGFKGGRTLAYNALLAAQKYQGVDILEDLRFLSITDTMKGITDNVIKSLFELYSDRMTDADVAQLKEAWSDDPARQGFILRRAKEHGLMLDAKE